MMRLLRDLIREEDGLGTVEIVIIIAVLVGLALLFRNAIRSFVTAMIDKMFPDADDLENNKDLAKTSK